MRTMILSAAAWAAIANVAAAAPAEVRVAVAPALQATFEKTYGVREANLLKDELRKSVEQSLADSRALDGARIELTLVDVKPNRPTFKQLADTPGLSMQSFGVGGAALEGRVITADGTERPVAYSWYESDFRQAYGRWVWSDAEWAFDRFARKLARGETLARR
ncbi:hypothetical protein [Phenylobacterium kunshanense]|uniref:DUF3016 domain-containing protein n=1 Tax=Phenylobacterium kunshanense TaxID=1445034 RepID=A0A328BV19_9CAUL|nr:hypothetical protein [Phenylobacterium kunshanense]RAK68898.1 hypothetical protein DJ019_02475 [Phenylobacterium kunshanense]